MESLFKLFGRSVKHVTIQKPHSIHRHCRTMICALIKGVRENLNHINDYCMNYVFELIKVIRVLSTYLIGCSAAQLKTK